MTTALATVNRELLRLVPLLLLIALLVGACNDQAVLS